MLLIWKICSTEFNQDISGWDVSKVTNMEGMFDYTNISNNYKPTFN